MFTFSSKRAARVTTRSRPSPFRPRVEVLEDRTVPSVALGFAQVIGGDGTGEVGSLSVSKVARDDAVGNLYLTGTLLRTVDFDVGETHPDGADILSSAWEAAFVAKYTAAGEFLWARQISATGGDQGWAASGSDIAVDVAGNVYATGWFLGTTASFGTIVLEGPAGDKGYLVRLDADGAFQWARRVNDAGIDSVGALAIDGAGNLVVTTSVNTGGNTGDWDAWDALLVKFTANGDRLWAVRVGGTGHDYGGVLAVDASYNIYVTGSFSGKVDFDPGPGTSILDSRTGTDFIWKLDADRRFLWARNLGGGSQARIAGIAVDAAGSVYTTGTFSGGRDFDPGKKVYKLTSEGSTDVFVSKLDAAGNFGWARRLGGIDWQEASRLALDGAGNVIICGIFYGAADFDPGPGTYTLTSSGSSDIFVVALSQDGAFLWAAAAGGAESDVATGLVVDPSGGVYVVGWFSSDQADFDPGSGIDYLPGPSRDGYEYGFLWKLVW